VNASKRNLALFVGLLIGIGVAVTAVAGGSDIVLDALLQRPHTQATTQVVPDRYLRRWDPVTVFFTSNRGKPGPEDRPERFVTLEPDHPGAWEWLDGKTLQFRPAEPWTPMSAVSITVDKKTTDVFTLAPPPRDTSPRAGARNLDPVSSLRLTFDDPLPPETLARLTTIELRPLPGLSDDGLVVLDADDFEVKTLERSSTSAPAPYTLVLDEPIPRGLQARVKIGLSLDTEAREAVHTVVFATAEPFRAVAAGCTGSTVPLAPSGSMYAAEQPLTCTSSRSVQVRFNANPAGLGPVEGRNLVRFEPAVEGLTFQTSGSTLTVRGDFAEETRYRMAVEPTVLSDVAGRPLQMDGPSAVYFRFERKNPYFKWGAGDGIVERYGPMRVPIEGRGTGQVDVRVHEVDPLNRELWPFPSSPIAIDERSRPPSPGEFPEPLAETARVDVQGLRSRLKALGTPGFSGLMDVGLEGAAAKSGLDLSEPLKQLSGTRGAGHYLVGVRRVDGSSERHWMRIQVTDLALTTLETGDELRLFVSSLASGRPVSGAKISVQGVVQRPREDARWETVLSGTTDAAGGVVIDPPGDDPNRSVRVQRIVVEKGRDTLVLDATQPPDRFQNGGWRGRSGTWLQWAFSDLSSRVEKPRLLGHVFTERPIYRPEEVVHIKGYLRRRFEGDLTAQQLSGEVRVLGPGGTSWRLPVTVSASGAYYAKWDESDIPTGTYRVQFVSKNNGTLGTTDFQVEAYRLPTFEVEVDVANDETTVPNDVPFEVSATATYYAGGQVASRPVRWNVTQYPYTMSENFEGLDGFRFSSDGRYSRSGRFDSTPAIQRTATTDRSGRASLTLDPGIEPTAQPRTYVIEATVTGADEQTVTATERVHAVPAFVLGLKAPRHVERAKSIPVEVVSVGPDGALKPGTDVTLRLVQRQWHSVLQASDYSDGVARYVTDTVDVPVSEQRLTTAGEALKLDLPIDEAGVYIVEIEARDALGRGQTVAVDLYAGGTGDVTWDRAEAGVFGITPDEASYAPGDTAKLVLRSPFQTGAALVVIEAPKGNVYKTVEVYGGKATVPVRIEEGWTPRIPVHVLLRRGRVADAGVVGATDLGKPETLASTRWLTIRPEENQILVELAHPEKAMPGETVDVTVTLNDPDGKPLAGEVTLWLVDQAVLALAPEKPLDPLPAFIPDRGSRFSAVDTRNLAFGRLPFSEMPGGDGGDEEARAEGLLDQVSVRRKFESVPFYDPSIQVGPSGTKTVKVQLPDNLTVFKVRAKATSGAERFGVGKSSLRVRLPVLVQPNLPRFVRPGDSLDIGGLARVVEGDGGAGEAEIRVDGLTLGADAKQTFTWSTDEAVGLSWPVTVPTPEPDAFGRLSRNQVTITVGAKRTADGAGDATEVVLPLLDDRRARSRRTVLDLPAGESAAIEALGETVRAGSLSRTVLVSDEPGLVKMGAAMDVFVGRPGRSSGRLIDQARAMIGLEQLRGTLGIDDQAMIDGAVNDALAWLPSVLTGQGLIAEWPGGRGQVGLTADAAMLVADAKEAGYAVDPKLEASIRRSLTSALRSDYRYFLDGSSWYERSRALEGLASLGTFEEAYFTELADRSKSLGPNGQSHVLLAAVRAGQADSAMAERLVSNLQDEVIVGLYEGEERYRGLKSTNPLSPLILAGETYTVAAMTQGLGRAAPEAEKVPYLIDALVRLGGEDGWGGRSDAPAMLALADRLKAARGDAVTVDIQGAAFSTENGAVRIPLSDGGERTLKHTGGPDGALLVTSRWIPAGPGSQAESRNLGFVVSRDQALYVVGSKTPSRVKLDEGGRQITLSTGQVVEEHVQIVNPEDRAYVAVEVPFAAGVELLNPALATAPKEAKASKSDTRAATWVLRGDASVTYFYEQLPKGTYDFYFRTRATTPGAFIQPPAVAETVYDRSITGNSPGAKVVVE
jgi:uncharacterized protein YfaS (alpha-2-macroglobulin family)